MSTKTGQRAERVAGAFLESKGYTIIDYNWRLPQCEIDIVAKKDETIFLVEVKYRTSLSYGGGFDYITSKKIKSMNFAAKNWSTYNNWRGDIALGAVSVTGEDFIIDGFVESII